MAERILQKDNLQVEDSLGKGQNFSQTELSHLQQLNLNSTKVLVTRARAVTCMTRALFYLRKRIAVRGFLVLTNACSGSCLPVQAYTLRSTEPSE